MKIVEVRPLIVGAGMRNWVFVKVVTDEGLVGWGEATTEWRTQAVVASIQDIAPLVEGQDAFRIEYLWQRMHRQQFWKGGVVSMSALSGIDQALHDIKAQALGVPIFELLGGRVRERLRLYDHLGGGSPDAVYGEVNPAAFADAAVRSVEDGFTAVKILAVPAGPALPDSASLRLAGEAMGAVRSAVGDDVEIMVDLHGRCSPAAAVAYMRALEPGRPWFIEEPCQPELVDVLPRLAASTSTPLALGERLVGRAEFGRVLRTEALGVIQPDVCHCGGLSEMRRIAAMAETHGVAVAPHNPLGPIATMHNLHFAAATPNWIVQEQMRGAVPWFDDVVTQPLAIDGGYAAVPAGPGLGTAVDEEQAKRHPYQPEKQVAAALADDSVADW